MAILTFGTRAFSLTVEDEIKREELLRLIDELTSDTVLANTLKRAIGIIAAGKKNRLPEPMKAIISGPTTHLPLGNAKINEGTRERILSLLRSSYMNPNRRLIYNRRIQMAQLGEARNIEENPVHRVKSQIVKYGVDLYLAYVGKGEGEPNREYSTEDYSDFFSFLAENISFLDDESMSRIRTWVTTSRFQEFLRADFSNLEGLSVLFEVPILKEEPKHGESFKEGAPIKVNASRAVYLIRHKAKSKARLAKSIAQNSTQFDFRVASTLFSVLAGGDGSYIYDRSDFVPIFDAYLKKDPEQFPKIVEYFHNDLRKSKFRFRLRDDFAAEYPFIFEILGVAPGEIIKSGEVETTLDEIHFPYTHFRHMSEKRRGRIFALLRTLDDTESKNIIAVLHKIANGQKIDDTAVNIGELPESIREEIRQHISITQFSMRIGSLDGKRATELMESEKENEITRDPEIVKCWLERVKNNKLGIDITVMDAILDRFEAEGLGTPTDIREINALIEALFGEMPPRNHHVQSDRMDGNGHVSLEQAKRAGLGDDLAWKLSRGELDKRMGSTSKKPSRKMGFRGALPTV